MTVVLESPSLYVKATYALVHKGARDYQTISSLSLLKWWSKNSKPGVLKNKIFFSILNIRYSEDFIIRATGNSASITNKADFKPKVFF